MPKFDTEYKNAAKYLEENGWHRYTIRYVPPDGAYYAKTFDAATRCHCNKERNGIQVCIFLYQISWLLMEVELNGQLSDGTWINLKNYALPKDVEVVVDLIPRMIAMWEAANSATPALNEKAQS